MTREIIAAQKTQELGDFLAELLRDLHRGRLTEEEIAIWIKIVKANPRKARTKVKRTMKDSIFCDLFSEIDNIHKLFKVMYPKKRRISKKDIKLLTVDRILTTGIYNDLGFLVRNRLIVLVEAQSTWTVNVLIRFLSYLARTYDDYISDTIQSPHDTTKLKLPRPELFVVYTGKKRNIPDEISFQAEFNAKGGSLELTAKVLRLSDEKNILTDYINVCLIIEKHMKGVKDEQKQAEALNLAINECIQKGYLKEYLESKRKEILEMLAQYYTEVNYLDISMRAERAAGKVEGKIEQLRKSVLGMLKAKLPLKKIAEIEEITIDKVKAIRDGKE